MARTKSKQKRKRLLIRRKWKLRHKRLPKKLEANEEKKVKMTVPPPKAEKPPQEETAKKETGSTTEVPETSD